MAANSILLERQYKLDFLTILNEIFLFSYIFFSVLMPYDNFYIKKISLLILFIVNIRNFQINGCFYKTILLIFSFIVIPFSAIVTIVNSNNEFINVLTEAFNILYFFLILLPLHKRDNAIKYFIFSLKILCLIIIFAIILDKTGLMDIYNNPLLNWYRSSGNAMIGKSSGYFFYYVIFFKSSPIILYLLFYSIKNKKIFWIILSFFSLLFTGTRANFFITIIFTFVALFIEFKNLRLILITLLSFALMLSFNYITDFIYQTNLAKESSDLIRTLDLNKVINDLMKSPFYLLFGQGIGSYFFSVSRGQYVSNIELSYINILRQFGVLGSIPFFSIFLLPTIEFIRKKDVVAFLSIVAFLVICWTNPFLFGSTGATLLLVCITDLQKTKDKNGMRLKTIFY